MTPSVPDVVLKFENVTVLFEEEPVLKDVSLEVRQGETWILLGSAGSGKTVLLKTAMGLIRPDSGRVWLLGQDITEADERDMFAVRTKVGVLFQEGALFDSATVEENVAYPLLNQAGRNVDEASLRGIEERVKRALEFVELGHTLEKFPSELSGGMRRRVGIARALVTEPPLILYDSPTAGLDPITANTIMALVAKQRDTRNTASIVVTHRYQDGQLMANFHYNSQKGALEAGSANGKGSSPKTRFLVLREGRLVFSGMQPELEASGDPYVGKFVRR